MIEPECQQQINDVISRLREEREKAHFSQIELSFEAGLSQNQVNCIEAGRSIPNLYTLIKLCNALKISPKTLFSPTDKEREDAENTIISLVKKYI